MRASTTSAVRMVALVAAALLAALPSGAATVTIGDSELIVTAGDPRGSAVDVAVQLSRATPGAADRVAIGRDDLFADSLASAVLQQDGPLLLVPPEGPVPLAVREELGRLQATQAVLLGGAGALSPAVAEELTELGLTVTRRAGPTRLETAVAIAAADAPSADTAVLVRAFPTPGGPDSQAWADSLGAGALAARNGWPVLLTQREVLSGATRDHLAASAVQEVIVVGGTAAIGDAVVDELQQMGLATQRIAGADRFATAAALARFGGADSAADVGRVVLVGGEDEQAWAGGFAAARHALVTDAAVVLARDPADLPPHPPGQAGAEPLPLPDATADFLSGATFAGDVAGPPELTCVARPEFCEQGRRDLGHEPAPVTTFEPFSAPLTEGDQVTQQIVIEVTHQGGAQFDLRVASPCFGSSGIVVEQPVEFTFDRHLQYCPVEVGTVLPGGTSYTAVATYNVVPQDPEPFAPTLLSVDEAGAAVGRVVQADPLLAPDGTCAVFQAEGPVGGLDGTESGAHVFSYEVGTGEVRLLDRLADGGSAFNGATAHGVSRDCDAVLLRPTEPLDGDPDHEGLWLVDGLDPTRREFVSVDEAGDPVGAVAAPSLSDDGQVAVFAEPEAIVRYDAEAGLSIVVPYSALPSDPPVTAVRHTATDGDGSHSMISAVLEDGSHQVGRVQWDPDAFEVRWHEDDGDVALAFGDGPVDLSEDGTVGVAQAVVRAHPDAPAQPALTAVRLEFSITASLPQLPARSILGTAVAGAQSPALSADGRLMSFVRPPQGGADSTVNAAGDQGGCVPWIVRQHDLRTVSTVPLDVTYADPCRAVPALADDGRTVVLTVLPLAPEDTNDGVDAYLLPAPTVPAPRLPAATLSGATDRVVPL